MTSSVFSFTLCKHKAEVLPQTFYILPIHEVIAQNSVSVVRPKPKSSGLEVQVNLDFQDQNVYSQLLQYRQKRCLSSSYYQGFVERLFTIDCSYILSPDQICYRFWDTYVKYLILHSDFRKCLIIRPHLHYSESLWI